MNADQRSAVPAAPALAVIPSTEPDPLLRVEVRHLAALAAIARTRSFSKAGEELGYAQSAISQQMAVLEKAVGHKLVERPGGPRPVSLTEAGEVLLRHATSITARLSAAKADLDALAAGEAGELRVGTFQSAGARILPAVLARFRARWPLVDVRLSGLANEADLARMVLAGQLDLSFADVESVVAPLAFQELLVDPWVVIVAPDSPLAGLPEIHLSALADVDLITADSSDPCTRRLGRAFSSAGVTPRVVFRTDDNLTVQRLVSVGLGAAVVAELTVETHLDASDVVVIPLAPASAIHRRIGIIWHQDRYRSRAAQAFVDEAVAVAPSLASPRS